MATTYTKLAVGSGVILVGGLVVSSLLPKDKREVIVKAALGEVGQKTSKKYWDDVIGGGGPYPPDWCGGFALWALHQAGLATGTKWEVGKGFLYKLPITKDPKPGDIAYFSHNQHHAMVEKVVGDTVSLINGNGAGGAVSQSNGPKENVTAFYSIEKLLS